MNWIVFAIFTYLFIAFQEGLRNVIALPAGMGGMAPALLLVLGVYICLYARTHIALWSMLILGALTDLLTTTIPGGPVIGPAALGYMLAGIAVLQMRGFVFKQSIFTLAFLTFISGILSSLTIITLYKLRTLGWLTNEPIPGWYSAEQMFRYFMMLLYSSAVAFPLGFVLFKVLPIWNFTEKKAY